jgi:hypothetical protein
VALERLTLLRQLRHTLHCGVAGAAGATIDETATVFMWGLMTKTENSAMNF